MLSDLKEFFASKLMGESGDQNVSQLSCDADQRDDLYFVSPLDHNKIYRQPADICRDVYLMPEQKMHLLERWIMSANEKFRATHDLDFLTMSREASTIKRFLINETELNSNTESIVAS